MAAKSKAKTILVKLVSTAQTGYFYTTSRPRLGEKLVRMKYDPKVKQHVLFTESKMK
ncbi:39S ribosomal protein L33 [Rhizoctonia solani AG-3 Rhs1AP]|nr:39S ribosomal protein L33 [Rhizoctonia solani AG-3 Rhs1AP]KEP48289.1 39S ribosomal protein L33 [Rhizoctonia solani 123E]